MSWNVEDDMRLWQTHVQPQLDAPEVEISSDPVEAEAAQMAQLKAQLAAVNSMLALQVLFIHQCVHDCLMFCALGRCLSPPYLPPPYLTVSLLFSLSHLDTATLDAPLPISIAMKVILIPENEAVEWCV